MPLPWRSTWAPAPARSCAASWRACAGSGALGRSRWRAGAASRRPAPAWARRRCIGCMSKGSGRLRRTPPRGRGIGRGGWSAWTAPAWMWPTQPGTAPALGIQGASRGESAFPQLRFVALVENGTHVLFGAQMGRYADGETRLAHDVLTALRPGMLCLADRQFFGYALWQAAAATGADLLWRVKHNLRLPRATMLADGSYLTTLYPSDKDRRHGANGTRVRVVEYRLAGIAGADPLYRLVPTIWDPGQPPAAALAALYHERWEIEGALDELKTHLRGARVVLRSKTPELVRQEFWGLLMAHFAVRGLMHEAALRADEDPDRLSFLHAVRVVRRKPPLLAALPPSGQARPARGGAGRDPGGAGREQPRPKGAARGQAQDERLPAATARAATDHPDRLRRRHQDRKVNSIGLRCHL